MARIWKGGCIIRARLLDPGAPGVRGAVRRSSNLLVDPAIARDDAARRRPAGGASSRAAAAAGIPVPALSASLAYFDSYRTARLPQNLTQAQRDAFGAHTFERVEQPGFVHADWGRPEAGVFGPASCRSGDHAMATLNLASVLEHPARLTPDRVGDHVRRRSTSPTRELDAQATQVAAGLHAMGIRAGDHVALSCPNIPWFPIAYFGILKAGAAVVPLNVLLKPREIAYHLKDSDAKAILAFEGTPELPIGAMCARRPRRRRGTPHVIVDSAATLPSLHARRTAAFHPPRREPHDTAVILYTSGTTGQPKGAELTHGNMVGNAIASHDMFRPAFAGGIAQDVDADHAAALPFDGADRADERRPLRRLPARAAAALRSGRRARRLRARAGRPLDRRADDVLGAAAARARRAAPTSAPRRRRCGSACRAARRCRSRCCASSSATFSVRVLEGYGLSETAPVVAFNQLQRPSKPGTVGLPIFGVEVRCVDEHDIARCRRASAARSSSAART